MMYYELWFILWNWKRQFSVKEFATIFASPDPNKVLYDMAKKGLLERVKWGFYKVNSPEKYLTKKVNITKAYEIIREAGLNYSLTEADAVFFWTKGGYQVDRFFGFYPIHLKVNKNQGEKWKDFLKSKNQKIHIEGQSIRETLFGVFYVLYPVDNFRTELVDGFKVDPLKETIEFCKSRIYSYEPALEMLDDMYHLNLEVEYKEIKTNS